MECVYLEGNPVARDGGYRRRVKELLPTLLQIDACAIEHEGRGWGGGGLETGHVEGYGMGSMTDAMRVEMMRKLQEKAVERAEEQGKETGTK